ncbi:phospholipase [Bradyrhizobium sp. G127]|uniref:phospholipase n=1 Tax=Bradyrhizobium sp. G127 TaxID=2904800 RepID=UPI001F42CDE7|nr:phospholipase [Bradyrhizobium sp. G127]MCF2523430.1 phospholipase [Bradyrhizobium sp. G127]
MTTGSETILPPLFACLETLSLIARHLDPSSFAEMMGAAGTPWERLRAARSQFSPVDGVDERLATASDEALAAFDELRAALDGGDIRAVFKALRHTPRALEALYPLAAMIPAVNSFFLDPSLRTDAETLARGMLPARAGETGVIHFDNEPRTRGGFSLYVPESYTPDRAWPLVVALHGGSGHGRGFLWSWLRDARSFGAILVAPTSSGNSLGSTWALMGDDNDTPNLARIVAQVRETWNIDPDRLLLTGMSDGGTFCYVSALDGASPFTHLAPVSATFHPMLISMADADRLRGLPVYLVHGALDWMFPVEVARQAKAALTAAGANVTYSEIDDLSHTYPREINAPMIAWLKA